FRIDFDPCRIQGSAVRWIVGDPARVDGAFHRVSINDDVARLDFSLRDLVPAVRRLQDLIHLVVANPEGTVGHVLGPEGETVAVVLQRVLVGPSLWPGHLDGVTVLQFRLEDLNLLRRCETYSGKYLVLKC